MEFGLTTTKATTTIMLRPRPQP